MIESPCSNVVGLTYGSMNITWFDNTTAREDAAHLPPRNQIKIDSVDNRVAKPSQELSAVPTSLAKSPNEFHSSP